MPQAATALKVSFFTEAAAVATSARRELDLSLLFKSNAVVSSRKLGPRVKPLSFAECEPLAKKLASFYEPLFCGHLPMTMTILFLTQMNMGG